MPIPPDTRAPGDSGHVADHNNIADALTTLAAKAANLSDLASAATARTNLGLGSAATQSASAFDASGAASTAQSAAQTFATSAVSAAAALAAQKASNLSDLASPGTARTNLGLGTAATQPSTAFDTAGAAAAAALASLPTAGGTMSGAIAMGSNNITGLANGTASGHAAGYLQVYEVLNVKGAGAAGNGSTDDSGILNTAITTANAAGGGPVFMPPGAYHLAAGLIMKSNVTLKGAGALKSTLRPASGVVAIHAPGGPSASTVSFTATNAAPAVFTVGSGSAPGVGVAVTLTGGSLPGGFTASTPYYVVVSSGTAFQLAAWASGPALASSSSGSGNVVQAGQLTQMVFEDFGIVGPGQGVGSAPGMSASWCTTGTRMHRLYVTTCGGDGIAAVNCYTVSLRDTFGSYNGGNGLNAQYNVNSWAMSGNSFAGNTRWGYYIMGGAASVLSCCDAETNGYGGMALLGTYSFTAEGCELENNGSSGSGQQCGIYVGAGTTPYGQSQNTALRGNWLQGTSVANYGIVVDGAVLTELAGNGFQNNLTNHILVTGSAASTLIRHGNYLSTPSGGNVSDAGTHTQMMDYDATNAAMRSSGLSFGAAAGAAADVTLLHGPHPGQLIVSGAAPTFGAVLRVLNTQTAVPVPALYVTATASTDLAIGTAYGGAAFLPFQFKANGQVGWGPGSAGVDTFLARSAAGQLQATVPSGALASVQTAETALYQRMFAV